MVSAGRIRKGEGAQLEEVEQCITTALRGSVKKGGEREERTTKTGTENKWNSEGRHVARHSGPNRAEQGGELSGCGAVEGKI